MAIQTFTSGQVLTAAQQNALQANDYNQTVSTKTASYTLVAADKGTRIVMNVASANTITVNTSLFSAGDTVVLQNIGAGVSTVTAGTATVSSAGPLAIPQYGSGTLYFTSAGVSIYFPSAVTAVSSSGLNFITSGTFSGVSQGTITNVFSATYDNYRLLVNASAFDGATYILFGTGGTPSVLTNTDSSMVRGGATVDSVSVAGSVKGEFARTMEDCNCSVDIFSPNLAENTKYNATSQGRSATPANFTDVAGGVVRNSVQFTDVTLRSDSHPSGTITFKYKVYGYSNS